MKAVVAFLLLSCLAISAAWQCKEAPKLKHSKQIDAAMGLAVATTRIHFAYMLIGKKWVKLGTTRVRHVTVGHAGIWAAGKFNKVYRHLCGRFRQAKGKKMKQMDAGGDKNIVGVSAAAKANCLRKRHAMAFSGSGSLSWKKISNLKMKYISTTFNGHGQTWGVLSNHRIVCSRASNAKTCSFAPWTYVKGSLTMVEVSASGTVFGVTKKGKVLLRLGISKHSPHGKSWLPIPICMAVRHVSADVGKLWAVSKSGMIFTCTRP